VSGAGKAPIACPRRGGPLHREFAVRGAIATQAAERLMAEARAAEHTRATR
jgi:hypothetical protein